MTGSYPLPDLLPAFIARLRRLLDALMTALADDRDVLLVIPQCSDPNEQQRWLSQMMQERLHRPHLTTYWQALTPNPAMHAPPVPWTVGIALKIVVEGLQDLAAELEAEVLFCVEKTVEPKHVPAVLARTSVVQGWPRPRMETGVAAFALQSLTAALRALPEGEHPPSHHLVGYSEEDAPVVFYYWPTKAAPADVAAWARKGLNDIGGSGDAFFAEAMRGTMPSDILLPHNGKLYRIPFAGLGVLYLAERDVLEKLGRPTAAVSATKVHHEVMTGMRTLPNPRRKPGDLLALTRRTEADQRGGMFLLTGPGASGVQLAMPFEGEAPHEGVILRLKEMHGPNGGKYIRHWTALNVLWSIQGARQGWVRWTLDAHLDALGYSADTRQDPHKRAEVAAEVEHLTRLELVRLDESGTRRYEAPLIHVGARERERDGDGWRLDGMILRANELVYGGVRDAASGQLGRDWIGVPAELAKIDHVRHPYAHALGLVIPMRARWRIGDEEEEARRRQLALHAGRHALAPVWPEGIVEMSGEKLLKSFVPPTVRTDRAMRGIRRDIEALVRIEVFAPVEWRGEPWSLGGVIRFRLTPWLLDRAVRGLHPVERAPIETPLTGGELTAWRTKRGWSQREASRQLQVSQATLSGAEAKPSASLGPKVRKQLQALITRGPGD